MFINNNNFWNNQNLRDSLNMWMLLAQINSNTLIEWNFLGLNSISTKIRRSTICVSLSARPRLFCKNLRDWKRKRYKSLESETLKALAKKQKNDQCFKYFVLEVDHSWSNWLEFRSALIFHTFNKSLLKDLFWKWNCYQLIILEK